jgi:acylphosphatase
MAEEIAIAVRVEGRVQGVWYRGWTVDEAQKRSLRGWVRNRRDGSVEALFIGSRSVVEDMIGACNQGPSAARVTSVRQAPAIDDGSVGFRQRASL